VATGNGLTGGTIISTGTLTMSGSYTGIFTVNEGQVWDPTTPGLNKGSIHIDPDEGTDHAGGAITWGASDASSGNTANAGIYIRSDGSYGTKMYLATTDSYATGSKTALNIDHSGNVNITRGFLQVSNGNISLSGTGRIQGVDTVSASTDAANKAYVDAHPGSGGTVTSVATTFPVQGGTITSSGTISVQTPQSGDWWNGGVAIVATDGVMEVGKYIDMHAADAATSDFDVRLTASTGSLNVSGDIVIGGGDITLGGTGRIQGVDTVSATTDAANKAYVDAHPGSGGTVTSVATGNGLTGGTITSTGTLTMSGDYTGNFSITGANLAGNSFSDPDIVLSITDEDTTDSIRNKISGSSAITKVSDATAPAPGCFQVNGSYYPQGFGPYYKISEGDEFIFELWIRYVSGAATYNLLYAGSNFYNAAGTYLGNSQRYWGEAALNINANTGTGWYHVSGTLGPNRGSGTGDIPTTAESMRLLFLFNYNPNGTIVTNYCGLKVYKSNPTVTKLYRKTLGSEASSSGRNRDLVVDSNGDIHTSSVIAPVGMTLEVDSGNVSALTIDNVGSTTFSGYTYFPNYLFHTGDTNTRIEFTTGTITLRGDTSIVLDGPTSTNANFTGTSATFSGDVTAATFNTLPIETARNNNANRIVRTNASGYVDFGWINTTSGATTSTIDRIYASNDSYIRYVTPATFRTQITDPYYAPATGGSYLPLAGGSMTGTITMGTQNFAVAGNYGRGVFGLYDSYKYQHLWSMGTAYKLPDNGSTTGNLYGVAWSHPNAGGTAANLSNHGMLVLLNGTYNAAISGSIRCITDMRTPIYYDSNNTAYYGDFASTSNFNTLTLAGSLTVQSGSGTMNGKATQLFEHGYGSDSGTFYQTSGSFAGYSGWANYWIGNHGNGATYYNTVDIRPFWGPPKYSRLEGGTFRGPYNYLTNENDQTIGVYLQSTTSLRAPIFYDYNNTAFYLDPSTTGTSVNVAGDVVAYASSDIRFKNNVTPITNALDKLSKIGGYTFEWNEISHKETGKKDIGVIAQEVEEILPEIVQTRSNGYKAVDYQKLTALLIESVKEQQFIIDDLKSRIERLEKF
jgi:hypothetical protein